MAPPRPPGPDTTSSAPTKADVSRLRSQAASNDQAWKRAYDTGHTDARAGRPGHSAPFDSEYADAYQAGVDDAGTDPSTGTAAGGGPPGPPAHAPGGPAAILRSASKADAAAGVALGVILYPIAINFLRGGPGAVRGWFAAKFLNRPYKGGLGSRSSPPAPVSPAKPPQPNTPVGPPVGLPSLWGPP